MTDARPNRERVAAVALAMAARPLLDLQPWEPVGSLLDTVAGTLRGGGITDRDASRLRVWAGRWCCVARPVRRFYGVVLSGWADARPDTVRAVTAALWAILEPSTTRRRVDAFNYRALRSAWVDLYGCEPVAELVPTGIMPTNPDRVTPGTNEPNGETNG